MHQAPDGFPSGTQRPSAHDYTPACSASRLMAIRPVSSCRLLSSKFKSMPGDSKKTLPRIVKNSLFTHRFIRPFIADDALLQRDDGRHAVADCGGFCNEPHVCTLPRGIEHGRPACVMPVLVFSLFKIPLMQITRHLKYFIIAVMRRWHRRAARRRCGSGCYAALEALT